MQNQCVLLHITFFLLNSQYNDKFDFLPSLLSYKPYKNCCIYSVRWETYMSRKRAWPLKAFPKIINGTRNVVWAVSERNIFHSVFSDDLQKFKTDRCDIFPLTENCKIDNNQSNGSGGFISWRGTDVTQNPEARTEQPEPKTSKTWSCISGLLGRDISGRRYTIISGRQTPFLFEASPARKVAHIRKV